jgi:adenylate cyclase
VLVFLGVAGWVLTRQTGRSAFSPEERGRSIGVLTFTLLAADSSYAYLAQGLSEDVSTALSGVSGLRVKAPSAVRRLQQASPADLESLGRNLGVNYLVDGSIRPLGEKLRVSVRLVTPEGEESSWAQTYDRAPTEMLDLPSDIARGIAAKLVGTDGTIAAQLRRSTTNPEAYDAYLKGNFHFTQRSEAALRLALASYQRALLLDSSFSAPRARIAMCYAQMLDYGWLPAGMTRSEVVALGQAVADTAVRRDSTSADAWVALGYLAMQQDPPDRLREIQAYERAIALDSNHLEAAMRLGFALILNGDYDAASQRLRQVLLLDQGFFTSYRALARIAALEGHLQHARALLDTAITLGPQSLPAFEDRAAINILLNDLAAAEQDLASVRRLQPHVGSRALVPMLEIAKGRPAAATDWLRANPEAPGEDRAAVLFALGRREEGVRILDEGRGTTLELIHARFWGLQSDSGFRAVLAEARRRENRSLR